MSEIDKMLAHAGQGDTTAAVIAQALATRELVEILGAVRDAVAGQAGPCGDRAPTMRLPDGSTLDLHCLLRAGHAGCHEAGDAAWREPDASGCELDSMMTVSTRHLAQGLGVGGLTEVEGLTVHDYEYGFFVWVSPDANLADWQEEGSSTVKALLGLARSAGASWLRFDGEGPIMDGFETWDW